MTNEIRKPTPAFSRFAGEQSGFKKISMMLLHCKNGINEIIPLIIIPRTAKKIMILPSTLLKLILPSEWL
jgi:hypothetical protein